MERTSTQIRVWFWTRGDGAIPAGVTNGASSLDTSKWPTPGALFPNTQCNLANHFGAHNIIINLTFCEFS